MKRFLILLLFAVGANAQTITTSTNTVTRPATTPSLTANQAVGTGLPVVLTNVVASVKPARIMKVIVSAQQTSYTPTLRVWFYAGTNVTAQTDASAFAINAVDAASTLGYVDVGPLNTGTDCLIEENALARLPISPTTNSIAFAIQSLTAWNPASSLKILVSVTTSQ